MQKLYEYTKREVKQLSKLNDDAHDGSQEPRSEIQTLKFKDGLRTFKISNCEVWGITSINLTI
jgi:hypothetical protein